MSIMTLAELVPSVRSLTAVEKKELMRILSEELGEQADVVDMDLPADFVSPWNDHQAAAELLRFFEQTRKKS